MSAMSGSTRVVHLLKRFVGSLSLAVPEPNDERWAERHLLAHEVALWRQMGAVDRRHALVVARRFESVRTEASREEMAAALLHDVGKLASGLGTFGRVAATLAGPRSPRFRTYHDHERLGAEWLAAAGSAPETVALVLREGPAATALEQADDL